MKIEKGKFCLFRPSHDLPELVAYGYVACREGYTQISDDSSVETYVVIDQIRQARHVDERQIINEITRDEYASRVVKSACDWCFGLGKMGES